MGGSCYLSKRKEKERKKREMRKRLGEEGRVCGG